MKTKTQKYSKPCIILVVAMQFILPIVVFANISNLSEPMPSAIATDLIRSEQYVLVSEEEQDLNWTQICFKEPGREGTFFLRFTQCENIDDAKRLFLQSRLRISTGGSPAGFEAGDQVVRFSGDTFLVRQANILYMVFGKDVNPTRVVTFLRHVEAVFSRSNEAVEEENAKP